MITESDETIDFLAKELARVTKERDKFKEDCRHYISQMAKHAEECGSKDLLKLRTTMALMSDSLSTAKSDILRLKEEREEAQRALQNAGDKLNAIKVMSEWK
jgi:hypothetical protein